MALIRGTARASTPKEGHHMLTLQGLAELHDRDSLIDALDGRSRTEIRKTVADIGAEHVVSRVIEVLNGAAAPRGDLPANAVVQWQVTSDGTAPINFLFLIVDRQFDAVAGIHDRPIASITLDVADFLLLMAGQLDVVKAFLSRRLRVTGDVMFARTINTWFDR
jgi:hypothetical protein